MATRSGMTDLIQRVRDLSAAGGDDYTIDLTTYWSDDQIQAALDRNRVDVVDEAVPPTASVASGGTTEYKLYQSRWRSLEETTGGTAVFYLRDGTGTRVGTASYSVDYDLGRVEFASSVTGGSTLYLNARAYDVYGAAADIWRQKAAHVASRMDFSADGASFKASQLVTQYERQAQACARKATFGEAAGVQTVTMYRDDVTLWTS